MAFWSTEKFAAEHNRFSIISDFDKSRLEHGRYYLRLDREGLVTPEGSTDGSLPGDDKCIRIPPGQFALLFTLESIQIPASAMGFISVRTSEKIKGLINVSGFHVDPGFKGHLKFSVYNAGNRLICLDYESSGFLLWLCDLDRPTEDSWDKKMHSSKILLRQKTANKCVTNAILQRHCIIGWKNWRNKSVQSSQSGPLLFFLCFWPLVLRLSSIGLVKRRTSLPQVSRCWAAHC
jgi:deoxycytidine triphosphate deaminase